MRNSFTIFESPKITVSDYVYHCIGRMPEHGFSIYYMRSKKTKNDYYKIHNQLYSVNEYTFNQAYDHAFQLFNSLECST